MNQNQNGNHNRGARTKLYELVPWTVYAWSAKARIGGVNYRPIARRSGPGVYYHLRDGHEAILSDGTPRKPITAEQAHEIVRRVAYLQSEGPIDHWFGAGAPVLPGGSLVTLRSEPDRRAYLIAGSSTASPAGPKPADPGLVVAGLPDEDALRALLGVPMIAYDLHSASLLVRRMQSVGMDAQLYSLPLRSIRDRAQQGLHGYEPKEVIVECQSIVLGLVPLGHHWVLPTHPISDEYARYFCVEVLPL